MLSAAAFAAGTSFPIILSVPSTIPRKKSAISPIPTITAFTILSILSTIPKTTWKSIIIIPITPALPITLFANVEKESIALPDAAIAVWNPIAIFVVITFQPKDIRFVTPFTCIPKV